MAIYITGDTHGDYRRFSMSCFPEQKEMTKDDYVIVCGDFGFWADDKEQRYWLDWLEKKPFTTLWVDGNHENYDLLASYPVEKWNGGNIQRIKPSVLHLMRGQVYEIENSRFFTFGGAQSHDISGGILDTKDPEFDRKKKKLDKEKISYRVDHVSWWKEELPSEEECEEGRKNVKKVGGMVDFVVTHCAPTDIQKIFGEGLYVPDRLTDYLMEVKETLDFKKWFFGHYHDNRNIQDKYVMLYEQIIPIVR